jgi:Flp pilus assembly protein CpaB
MTPRRTVIFVAAIVVALVAGGLSYYFLNNAQQQAFHNARLEQAYVVAKPIPRGLAGTDAVNGGYFAQKKVPAEIVPATSVLNLSSLAGTVAIANFPVGQILVSGMFTSPAQAAATFSQLIPPGDVAVAVSLADTAHAVANLPQPGDKVDIMVNTGGNQVYLLQNVPILAIGNQTTAQSGTATASTATPASGTAATTTSLVYTFAVTPLNAERLALAQQTGIPLYLALVPANNPVVSVPAFNAGNILSGPPS